MALDNEAKKTMLQQMLDSAEMDLFRQQVELDALNAEAEVVTDENQKAAVQVGIEQTQQALAKINARRDSWQKAYDAL